MAWDIDCMNIAITDLFYLFYLFLQRSPCFHYDITCNWNTTSVLINTETYNTN